MMSVEKQTEDTDTETKNSSTVGNSTQERFSTMVECIDCGEDTRLSNPSVGLVACDSCERVFMVKDDPRYGTDE